MTTHGPPSSVAGAVGGGIVGVFAVGDGGEVAFAGEGVHAGEEVGFAEVATVEGVAGVVRIFHFLGMDDFDRGAELAGEGEGVGEGLAREAGAVGDDAEHLVAQGAVGVGEEAGAIDAARVSDEQRGVGAQDRGEGVEFGGHAGNVSRKGAKAQRRFFGG